MSLSGFVAKASPEVQMVVVASATVISVVSMFLGNFDIALYWTLSLTPMGAFMSVANSKQLSAFLKRFDLVAVASKVPSDPISTMGDEAGTQLGSKEQVNPDVPTLPGTVGDNN